MSERYLQSLRHYLGSFARAFRCSIVSVTGVEIDVWLRSLGVSNRTRNNLRGSIQTLFNYAKARKCIPRDHDEIASVPVARDTGGEIEIFTPQEMSDLLRFAPDYHIPFLALGAFVGVRHAEIQRLDWKDIHFDAGIIEIKAAKAKTASRRTIPILDNLRAWLVPYAQPSGPVCKHRNMAFELAELVRHMNQALNEEQANRTVKWRHNALRHSFISYRVAQVQNVAQVALEAGNSPQTIFSNRAIQLTPVPSTRWAGVERGLPPTICL
jgi:integrase